MHLCQTRSTCNWKTIVKVLGYLTVFGCVCALVIIYVHNEEDMACYPRVGCFDLSGPWLERPRLFNFFPKSPNSINTTFILASRKQNTGQHEINLYSAFHIKAMEKFQWGRDNLIVFIIHGYTDDSTTWMTSLKDAFLNLGDITVILVDWRSGASGYYPQVVANTRVVAREIRILIQFLNRKFKKRKRFHLVGHSLGAQIASYVGKSFKGPQSIYQITALDPAFPLFEGFSSQIRLHRSDASHVIVLHSNIGPWGLGMKEAVGSVDIYLNNGRDQRGCLLMSSIIKEPLQLQPKTINFDSISHLKDLVACSHRRAYEILEDILRNLRISLYSHVAYPMQLTNDSELATGQLSHCQRKSDDCWSLKWDKESFFFRLPSMNWSIHGQARTFFMPTSDNVPFCSKGAYLEILTCPSPIPFPIDSPFDQPVAFDENSVSISQIIFGVEINIFSGKLVGNQKIKAWIELPCDSLTKPAKALTIQLSVTYESTLRNQNTTISSNSTRVRATFCWLEMQLTYFNSNDLIRLKPCKSAKDAYSSDQTDQPMKSSNHCIEVRFIE